MAKELSCEMLYPISSLIQRIGKDSITKELVPWRISLLLFFSIYVQLSTRIIALMAALPSFARWRNRASINEQADQLLGYEVAGITAKDKTKVSTAILRAYILLLHVVLLALVLWQWEFVPQTSNSYFVEKVSWSPIKDFIEYELRELQLDPNNKVEFFGGAPTKQQDDARDYLINAAFFNASLDEFLRAGESLDDLAELKDGGFLASLGVYHELHCLRQIRLYVYKEVYYPKISGKDKYYLQDHVAHCLEALRRTIMCYGNTAITSFHWTTPDLLSPEPRSNTRSVCAKWDTIESWAYSRRVSVNPDYTRTFENALL
ncbi:hypothetical protein GGR55DRAFT_636306 [Xylaria sp. FL0064]|nr:hypothetical protein GGR55DRAFT_636306 [Xylaria sp. FL0064]